MYIYYFIILIKINVSLLSSKDKLINICRFLILNKTLLTLNQDNWLFLLGYMYVLNNSLVSSIAQLTKLLRPNLLFLCKIRTFYIKDQSKCCCSRFQAPMLILYLADIHETFGEMSNLCMTNSIQHSKGCALMIFVKCCAMAWEFNSSQREHFQRLTDWVRRCLINDARLRLF